MNKSFIFGIASTLAVVALAGGGYWLGQSSAKDDGSKSSSMVQSAEAASVAEVKVDGEVTEIKPLIQEKKLTVKKPTSAIAQSYVEDDDMATPEISTSKPVSLDCHYEVNLYCTETNSDNSCAKTDILVRWPNDSYARILKNPKEVGNDYTPVSMSCATSPSGKHYLSVTFSELPNGCKFCEFRYLYDLTDDPGQQLTQSIPLILEDSTLPAGQTQYPNNVAYQKLIKQLKLTLSSPEVFSVQ